MEHNSIGFVVGIVLLIFNVPVGLAGLGLGAYMAKRTGKKSFYTVGTAIYMLSWLMLGAGIWLFGSRGIILMKSFSAQHPWLKYISPVIFIGIIAYALFARSRNRPAPDR